MQIQSEPPLGQSNQYSADSACAHCDGIIRHEPWCATLSPEVGYAFWAVSNSNPLSLGDEISLHALGVTWLAQDLQAA
jgi:hypothetical protein